MTRGPQMQQGQGLIHQGIRARNRETIRLLYRLTINLAALRSDTPIKHEVGNPSESRIPRSELGGSGRIEWRNR